MVNLGIKKYWSLKIKYLILVEHSTSMIFPQEDLWLIPLTVFRETVEKKTMLWIILSFHLKVTRVSCRTLHRLRDKHSIHCEFRTYGNRYLFWISKNQCFLTVKKIIIIKPGQGIFVIWDRQLFWAKWLQSNGFLQEVYFRIKSIYSYDISPCLDTNWVLSEKETVSGEYSNA